MKKIRTCEYTGEKDIFFPLMGFKVVDVEDATTSEGGEAVILKFVNERGVAIDICFLDAMVTVSEPYIFDSDIATNQSDGEKIEALYSDFLENGISQAPKTLRDAYDSLTQAFESYLCEIQTHGFKDAYKYFNQEK